MPNFDVFIKDEGYQDVRFVSKKAKQWAHKNKIPNDWEGISKDCFDAKTKKMGLYARSVRLSNKGIHEFISIMENDGLKVASEF